MCCSLLKYFFHFEFVVALWLRPLDKMICMSDEGITSIQTNKRTHTHTLSGGAYAKRRKVCRTFVWACIEVKCCCLRCPLCYRAAFAATATATLRQLCFSSGQMQMPFHKDKWSSKQQQQQQQKLQQQQVKKRTCNRIRQTFLLIRKSIAKSHLADDFSD